MSSIYRLRVASYERYLKKCLVLSKDSLLIFDTEGYLGYERVTIIANKCIYAYVYVYACILYIIHVCLKINK